MGLDFALLNKVVWLAPQTLLKNGTMAALLAVKDVAALGVTKAAELTVNNLGRTGSGASAAVNPTARKRRTRYLPAPLETLLARLRVPGALDLRRGECVLEVTLYHGRRMTRCKRGPRGERTDHLAVNAQAIVQLYKSDADDGHLRIVEQQASGLRLWTKAPSWGGETFLLGPVAAVETTTVRVVCMHRNLGGIAKKTPGKYATFGMRFGRRRAPPEGIVDDDLGGSLARNRGSEPTSEIELSLSQLFLLGKAGPRKLMRRVFEEIADEQRLDRLRYWLRSKLTDEEQASWDDVLIAAQAAFPEEYARAVAAAEKAVVKADEKANAAPPKKKRKKKGKPDAAEELAEQAAK